MKFLIMAGGTGGHVFPALAVAHELRRRGHEVVWMGAPDSFESRTVPQQGFAIEFVNVTGLRGKGLVTLLGAPLKLLRAITQAWKILSRQKPNAVLGMGGFAAGPGGIAAWLRNIPLLIHEQNATPGMTNRLLSRFAIEVMEAFPGTFKQARTVGNPVREGFAQLADPSERLSERAGGISHLLVIGGSQGARALNLQVPAALALIDPDIRPRVRHQAGRTLALARDAYEKAGVSAQIEAFIEDVPSAFAEADLVLCRAGASTIAELSAAGCASLLVPFPFAVDDHQTRNAQFLTSVNAARMIAESDLSAEALASELTELLSDRTRLIEMAQAARRNAWSDACAVIADNCQRVGGAEA